VNFSAPARYISSFPVQATTYTEESPSHKRSPYHLVYTKSIARSYASTSQSISSVNEVTCCGLKAFMLQESIALSHSRAIGLWSRAATSLMIGFGRILVAFGFMCPCWSVDAAPELTVTFRVR